MQIRAHFHGAPGRLPFVGHFAVQRSLGPVSLSAAGRVASRADVETAFRAARRLEHAVERVSLDPSSGGPAALSSTWAAIVAMEALDLGPHGGDDLSILLAASDARDISIAGMGLGGVWALRAGKLSPLATGDHPLLGEPGRPGQLPGVLGLEERIQDIVAVGAEHPVTSVQPERLLQRCGVHP